MSKIICLLALVALSHTAAAVNNAAALKSIAGAYGSGLTGFKAVIARLMVKNAAGTTPAQQTAWATQLQKDVLAMHSSFVSANSQLGTENARLTKVVGDLTAQTAKLEQQTVAQQKAVAVAQTLVTQRNNEVATNEKRVASAEANLASMQRAVNSANENVRKAREECIMRRRKRGWHPFKSIKKAIKKVTRPVEKVIRKVTKPLQKAICGTLNVLNHNVDKAKSNRAIAEAARNAAVAQLATSKQQRAVAQSQLIAAKTALTQKQQQVAFTLQQRKETQAHLAVTVDMETSVKAVIEHLDKVTVGSKKLNEFVADLEYLLVSVDTVLVPLNHISQQLTAQKIAGVTLTTIPTLTAAQKAQVQANLQQLKKTLE